MARLNPEHGWDRGARRYGRQEHLELRAVGRALDWAQAGPADRLLDVATGTGLVLRELARRPDRPARAFGVERSGPMLARVGPLPAGWEVVRGEATALPLPDAWADVATAAYLLQVLEAAETARVLAELRRVVRPGGRLVTVTTWAAPRAGRALLDAVAHAAPSVLGGLHTADARAALTRAGWVPERAAALRGGYPSLVVRARRG